MAHSPPHVDEPGATSRLRKLCAAKDAQIEGLTSRVEVLSDDMHDLMRERDYLLSTCSQLEDCAHQCQEEAAMLGERVASLDAELKTARELQGRASLPERRLSEGATSGLEERVAALEAELKSAHHRTEAAEAAQARVRRRSSALSLTLPTDPDPDLTRRVRRRSSARSARGGSGRTRRTARRARRRPSRPWRRRGPWRRRWPLWHGGTRGYRRANPSPGPSLNPSPQP